MESRHCRRHRRNGFDGDVAGSHLGDAFEHTLGDVCSQVIKRMTEKNVQLCTVAVEHGVVDLGYGFALNSHTYGLGDDFAH